MDEALFLDLFENGPFDGPVESRKWLETYISRLIFSNKHVYKFKKPLRYSFVDFSTLELRRHFCTVELKLNSRLANQVYLDVLPVGLSHGSWHIGQETGDDTIDYCVWMNRMDENKLMDRLLTGKEVDQTQIKILALKVAGFHQSCQTVDLDPEKYIQTQLIDFDDIENEIPIIERFLGVNWVARIKSAIESVHCFIDTHSDLFRQRLSNGFVRDLHGDLHSGNIFLYSDPIIFDCLEFDDHLRQIDVLNEVAFMCMDLEYREFFKFSKIFLKTYLSLSGSDFSSLEQNMFHFFKAYRANVKAKINALKLVSYSSCPPEQEVMKVRKYLLLMDHYISHIR